MYTVLNIDSTKLAASGFLSAGLPNLKDKTVRPFFL
jgi:hypothetical protein